MDPRLRGDDVNDGDSCHSYPALGASRLGSHLQMMLGDVFFPHTSARMEQCRGHDHPSRTHVPSVCCHSREGGNPSYMISYRNGMF
jgi:hypothetical protein